MGEVLQRLVQTLRFERDAFVWMDFNDRATGDALILVVVTQVLILLGGGASLFGLVGSLPTVLRVMLEALIFWLVFSGITYAAAKYLFRGDGAYATFLRIAGFAYPTLLVLLFTSRFIGNSSLAFLVGSLWFLAIVAYGVHYIADLDLPKSAACSGLGIVGWVIISAIFSGGLLF